MSKSNKLPFPKVLKDIGKASSVLYGMGAKTETVVKAYSNLLETDGWTREEYSQALLGWLFNPPSVAIFPGEDLGEIPFSPIS
jgi:hypothetical protein